jgi:hypothetical protein
MHSLDFTGNYGGRLIPTDANKLAYAPVLGISLSARVPVNPLQRIFYAVGRVGPLFVSQREGTGQGFRSRFNRFAIPGKLPGINLAEIVFPIIVERSDANYLTLFNIHKTGCPAAYQTPEGQ